MSETMGNRGRGRPAFTLIELLVVVAVIAILAALAMPVILSGLSQGQAARCKSNLHQMGVALTNYIRDYNGLLPRSDDSETRVIDQGKWWRTCQGILVPYLNDFMVQQCPADVGLATELGGPRWWSYGWYTNYYNEDSNKWTGQRHRNISEIRNPSICIDFLDHTERDGGVDGNNDLPYQPNAVNREDGLGMKRHNGGFEAAFVDGHVDHFKPGPVCGPKHFDW
ncbi:MAG: type II secretion system protein [Planctomycetota bacterium]